jgi:hypothetical protein
VKNDQKSGLVDERQVTRMSEYGMKRINKGIRQQMIYWFVSSNHMTVPFEISGSHLSGLRLWQGAREKHFWRESMEAASE